MSESLVGVGIIGFGRIGAEHAAWLSQATNARAIAVADATPARQAIARERGLRVYATPAELLADPQVAAVLVATPTAMHVEHATAALAAGRHLVVEKPMALDLPQAKQLVALARQKDLVLSVFHNRRWDIDFLTVKKTVEAGVLGKLINVESRLGQWASCVGPAAKEYRPGWRNEASFGGGGLYDWGSHFVDQLWRLLWPAKPVRVYAQLRGNVWTNDCDDFARVLIDFDNGVAGLCEINTTTTTPLDRWRLDGTRGSASSPHSAAFDTKAWAHLRHTPAPATGPLTAEMAIAPIDLPKSDPGLTETQIWEQFAAAVQGKGEPAVRAESVLCTMAVLDAARESSRTGKAIDVSDAVEWVL
ncbi:Gfo/Idh/MocA family protein [Humisphaera borealis]|uniref:Gfo/Idh/MocA family oxidoreductase n=1 Tax=Humisphaera borealis TaxID=2807512 RepID=A0A7M2WQY7_9BACT|nr:Gfo/Idh/MocA family oxidoreductase [Humisphaera borealis]QOV87886.1 Gfo/Idh/MocA family oxidoreductase [Humisphaera borealis]